MVARANRGREHRHTKRTATMPLQAVSTGGVLAYIALALASARCWCHGAENPLFRKAAAYEPGAGAPSRRVWVSTEQPCERARARAGSREEEKRDLVAGSSRGAWSTRVGGGTEAWTWRLLIQPGRHDGQPRRLKN